MGKVVRHFVDDYTLIYEDRSGLQCNNCRSAADFQVLQPTTELVLKPGFRKLKSGLGAGSINVTFTFAVNPETELRMTRDSH